MEVTPKEATEKQKRDWSFWDNPFLKSEMYRQQYQHLERCHVICYYKRLFCTNFGSMLVMSPQLSCQELTIKDAPEVWYLFFDAAGKLLDMSVC